MNWQSLLILALVIAAAVLALRYIRNGKKTECDGHCADCAFRCGTKKE